jgi:glycerol-3-phosphate dehydrogenase
MPTPTEPGLNRAVHLARLQRAGRVDVVVIGGGATGLGVALDAAARGWQVALFESHDFAQGTSSRSTKLLHGGVRYLAQGHWPLVREALHERATVLAQAPHVAQPLPFVVPGYRWWHRAFYGAGLFLYGWLAGRRGLGPTDLLSTAQARDCLPTLRSRGLRGGIRYWDGQFDDARLALALARTAAAHGASLLNHCPVTALRQTAGRVTGVTVRDRESGATWHVDAGCVINATGVWVDAVQRMDAGVEAPAARVTPSQGVHLVVDRAFLPGRHALLVPKTRDGRVLFAIPWLGKTLLGTTDTPRTDLPLEPDPTAAEVDFILEEAARVLQPAPTRADVRSVWVGLRPLVTAPQGAGATASLSREHSVWSDARGLVSVTGGKWTTYRAMAEDVLRHCQRVGGLPAREPVTAALPLWGLPGPDDPVVAVSEWPGEHGYGSDRAVLRRLPGADRALWEEAGHVCLSEAMVRHAVRSEMARTVADVLARRSRLLFLDARRAHDLAPRVGELMAEELGPDFDAAASVAECQALAARYLLLPS